MRVAVLSDMHGNATALEAVLLELDSQLVDHIVCLGDMVGYGARPGLCVRLVREYSDAVIRGNHDRAVLRPEEAGSFNDAAAAALEWTRARLTDDEYAYLSSLPASRHHPGMLLCHGAPSDPGRYISGLRQAATEFARFTETVCLFGHTHVPACIHAPRGEHAFADCDATHPSPGRPVGLRRDLRYLLNPGSVGQPRDLDSRAAFMVVDTGTSSATLRRVPYDVGAEQARMAAEGLPARLIQRLAVGV